RKAITTALLSRTSSRRCHAPRKSWSWNPTGRVSVETAGGDPASIAVSRIENHPGVGIVGPRAAESKEGTNRESCSHPRHAITTVVAYQGNTVRCLGRM